MNHAQTFNLVCTVVALLAGVYIFVGFVRAQWRATKASNETIAVDAECVLRSYSIYIDGEKIGTCTGAGLLLDDEETQLTFSQLVPMSAPHFRKLQHAFRNRERVNVAIGIVDEDVIQLGMMRVDNLLLETDHDTCSTTLETTLTGPTLVLPLELSEKTPTVYVSVVDPESVAAAFDAIEARAMRARENTTQAS